jgi:hypothetical protein
MITNEQKKILLDNPDLNVKVNYTQAGTVDIINGKNFINSKLPTLAHKVLGIYLKDRVTPFQEPSISEVSLTESEIAFLEQNKKKEKKQVKQVPELSLDASDEVALEAEIEKPIDLIEIQNTENE